MIEESEFRKENIEFLDKHYRKKIGRCRRCDHFADTVGWKRDADKDVWEIKDERYYCISCLEYFFLGTALIMGEIP